jgi:hypothetical protein
MLGEAEVLRMSGSRLAASDAQGDQALAEIFAAAGTGDDALGIRGIALPLSSRGGDRYVAHVLPLTSGARRQTGASFAAAATFPIPAAVNGMLPR